MDDNRGDKMTSLERVSWLIEKFKRFNYWLLYIVIAALAVTFILDSINPIVIKLIGVALFPFQKELVEELLVVIVWLPFAYVLLGPGHIVTDIFRNRMGRRLGFASDMLTGVAILVGGLVAFSASLIGTAYVIQFKSVKMGVVQFSLIPFYVSLNISFFLFIIADILLILKRIFAFKEEKSEMAAKSA